MYSLEDRMKAVNLYFKCGCSPTQGQACHVCTAYVRMRTMSTTVMAGLSKQKIPVAREDGDWPTSLSRGRWENPTSVSSPVLLVA